MDEHTKGPKAISSGSLIIHGFFACSAGLLVL